MEETLFEAARELGLGVDRLQIRALSGGSAAAAWRLQTPQRACFVKTLPAAQAKMLTDEAEGLAALDKTGTVRLPEVVGLGQAGNTAWLALEYLALQPRAEATDRRLGHQLARLHGHGDEQHGWHSDNHIGANRQINTRDSCWTRFFARNRLEFQFDLLIEKTGGAHLRALKQRVIAAWRRCAENHCPQPALLHGDLWSGNAAAVDERQPVIYDPTVHYGDRECDLAMTRLFGGFGQAFYRAYQETWPLPPGAAERQGFYRLYHLLNHAHLFGSAYRAAAENLARQLSARHP